MGNLDNYIPTDSPTVEAIYAHHKAKGDAEGNRGYLGASIIGHECGRNLWYGFRHCGQGSFDGRMYRLFETGDLAEDRFLAELKAIGCEVYGTDPQTGRQFGFTALAGHFGGHMDGAGQGFPEAPTAWHVLEFKTHNARSFATLRIKGVKLAKPMHYAQMQVYMHLSGMRRAMYMAVNKDTDEIYSERVKYCKAEAEALMARAERIVTATRPPERITDSPDDFRCRFCSHKALCHGSTPPEPAVPCELSCRNCVHATPELDTDSGRWSCSKHNITVTRQQQATTCEDHLFIPDLVTFAEAVDAGYDPVGGDWTEYRNRDDGATWRQGKNAAAGHYTSKELTRLPGPLIGAGDVARVKVEFRGTVADVRPFDPNESKDTKHYHAARIARQEGIATDVPPHPDERNPTDEPTPNLTV